MDIRVYTDGGCKTPGGIGGYGVVILKNNEVLTTLSAGFIHTTNNRMEQKGVIEALKYLINHDASPSDSVTVISDSKYVINTMAHGWKKGANKDLWDILDDLVTFFDYINWEWVKGHNGNVYNERCDALATQAMNTKTLGVDEGYEKERVAGSNTSKPTFNDAINTLANKTPNLGDGVVIDPNMRSTMRDIDNEMQLSTDNMLNYTKYDIMVGMQLIGTHSKDLYVISNIKIPVAREHIDVNSIIVALSHYVNSFENEILTYTMAEIAKCIDEDKLQIVK